MAIRHIGIALALVASVATAGFGFSTGQTDEQREPREPREVQSSTSRMSTGGRPPVDLSPKDGIPGSAIPAAAKAEVDEVVITGRVFYNDRRENGLFSTRLDRSGNPGKECDPNDTGCSPNWLAARYVVVEAFEIDDPALSVSRGGCFTTESLGRVAVGTSGNYTLRFPFEDACNGDLGGGMRIQLVMRTRFCGDAFCVSMNGEDGEPYELSHSQASYGQPKVVTAAGTVDMGDSFFNSSTDPDQPNLTSIAANYYASVIDTAVFVHVDNEVPFFDQYGEVKYEFPSSDSNTATAKAPDRVVISRFQSGAGVSFLPFKWVDGKTPAHEYGHILMQRAWGGDYGFKGVGISAGDDEVAPSQQIAFKEAWAEFVAKAALQGGIGCEVPEEDDNVFSSDDLFGALGTGASFRLNTWKALCDWYDNRDDDDPNLPGSGDNFAAADFYSMWFNLRHMYLARDQYGGEYKNPGLYFCDWVKYYTDVRKSVDAVGRAEHDRLDAKVVNLIYNNGIKCFRSEPD